MKSNFLESKQNLTAMLRFHPSNPITQHHLSCQQHLLKYRLYFQLSAPPQMPVVPPYPKDVSNTNQGVWLVTRKSIKRSTSIYANLENPGIKTTASHRQKSDHIATLAFHFSPAWSLLLDKICVCACKKLPSHQICKMATRK